jgi:hypothetical protein
MEDIYAPVVDEQAEEPGVFDQTITPLMLHKRGAIAPAKIQDSVVLHRSDKVVATELVIEKMLLFNHKDDNEILEWNLLDNEFEGESSDFISYSKMMNEMLHREARYVENGENKLYSVWGARVGRHSAQAEARKGELD